MSTIELHMPVAHKNWSPHTTQKKDRGTLQVSREPLRCCARIGYFVVALLNVIFSTLLFIIKVAAAILPLFIPLCFKCVRASISYTFSRIFTGDYFKEIFRGRAIAAAPKTEQEIAIDRFLSTHTTLQQILEKIDFTLANVRIDNVYFDTATLLDILTEKGIYNPKDPSHQDSLFENQVIRFQDHIRSLDSNAKFDPNEEKPYQANLKKLAETIIAKNDKTLLPTLAESFKDVIEVAIAFNGKDTLGIYTAVTTVQVGGIAVSYNLYFKNGLVIGTKSYPPETLARYMKIFGIPLFDDTQSKACQASANAELFKMAGITYDSDKDWTDQLVSALQLKSEEKQEEFLNKLVDGLSAHLKLYLAVASLKSLDDLYTAMCNETLNGKRFKHNEHLNGYVLIGQIDDYFPSAFNDAASKLIPHGSDPQETISGLSIKAHITRLGAVPTGKTMEDLQKELIDALLKRPTSEREEISSYFPMTNMITDKLQKLADEATNTTLIDGDFSIDGYRFTLNEINNLSDLKLRDRAIILKLEQVIADLGGTVPVTENSPKDTVPATENSPTDPDTASSHLIIRHINLIAYLITHKKQEMQSINTVLKDVVLLNPDLENHITERTELEKNCFIPREEKILALGGKVAARTVDNHAEIEENLDEQIIELLKQKPLAEQAAFEELVNSDNNSLTYYKHQVQQAHDTFMRTISDKSDQEKKTIYDQNGTYENKPLEFDLLKNQIKLGEYYYPLSYLINSIKPKIYTASSLEDADLKKLETLFKQLTGKSFAYETYTTASLDNKYREISLGLVNRLVQSSPEVRCEALKTLPLLDQTSLFTQIQQQEAESLGTVISQLKEDDFLTCKIDYDKEYTEVGTKKTNSQTYYIGFPAILNIREENPHLGNLKNAMELSLMALWVQELSSPQIIKIPKKREELIAEIKRLIEAKQALDPNFTCPPSAKKEGYRAYIWGQISQ